MDNWLSWMATQGFLPHGYCLQWSSDLVGLMVASDLGIAAAYYSIPIALVAIVRRRQDLHFGWVFLLFSLFIFSCGTTHVISLLNIWWPLYWVEASMKAVTAAVSLVTAVLLWPLLPRIVKLPSTRQLEELVQRLEREVQERRHAEQRLEELAAVLEQRVQERTLALEREVAEKERLLDADRAREVAERASRAKSEFLSRMSHEVRTPLNAVIGFAQLLQQSGVSQDPARTSAWGRRIEQAGQHLLHLIDDVLNIGQIESGLAKTHVEPVKVDELVGDCVAMVQTMALAAEVRIETSVEVDAPVLTDAQRLRQVMLNLLVNGIKYNRQDGMLAVSLRRPAAGSLAIEVRDTGIGMTPEQVANLFQPFNRLGRERGGPEGVGLGLVVVKNVLDLLGGEIAVESEPSVGTTIRVRWPVASPPPLPPPMPLPAGA